MPSQKLCCVTAMSLSASGHTSPQGEGARAVAVEAVDEGTHVDADDIALTELPVTRNPVDDLVVHRDAGGAGEAVVVEK